MILTYASCRVNRGFKWLNNAEKRRQPSGQRALDTLTAYITVNVAIDAIDAGKRLKGGELTGFEQKHVMLSKYRRVEHKSNEKKFIWKIVYMNKEIYLLLQDILLCIIKIKEEFVFQIKRISLLIRAQSLKSEKSLVSLNFRWDIVCQISHRICPRNIVQKDLCTSLCWRRFWPEPERFAIKLPATLSQTH